MGWSHDGWASAARMGWVEAEPCGCDQCTGEKEAVS